MAQVNGSIVLSKLQIENDEYQIISSAEDIVRFRTTDVNGDEVFETSPQVLSIELYKNGSVVDFRNSYNFYCIGLNKDLTISFGEQDVNEQGQIEIINPTTMFFNIQDVVKENVEFQLDTSVFVFEYTQNGRVIVSKAYQLRDGVTEEMAKFNITATAINSSIGSSKMAFTENGLEIIGGNFTIKENTGIIDENGKPIYNQLFGFDGTGNEAKLTMRGTVYAEDGEFTGKIHATDATFDKGTIGGFNIEDGKLVSLGKISENNEEVPAIELNGKNGQIVANNIVLGEQATIKKQIQLGTNGQASIYNPDENSGKFIESGNILISNNGTANFGEISVNGSDSKISGNNWSIGKDFANFSNINVSGAIETAVFKTNSVQAAGGAMLFRPSYKVSASFYDAETKIATCELEEKLDGTCFENQFWVISESENGTKGYHIGTVESGEKGSNIIKIKITEQFSGVIKSIIDLGKKTGQYLTNDTYPITGKTYYLDKTKELPISYAIEDLPLINENGTIETDGWLDENGVFQENSINREYYNNSYGFNLTNKYEEYLSEAIIGINSGNSKVCNDLIYPCGLTITSLDASSGPNLFLGDLSKLGKLNNVSYSGHGLYADNVFLNGSLTTKVNENSYAGINTLDGVPATAFGNDFEKRKTPSETDNSKIVFWAGAENTGAEAIAQAYFQVTEAGSLYAQRAKLEDTLFVGGSIEAAEIHTAKLHGKEGSLTIYDDAEGIMFKHIEESGSELDIFSINGEGLTANKINFINIGEKITVLGDQIKTSNGSNYLSLETIEEGEGKVVPVLKHIEGDNNCGFYFEKTQTAFKLNEYSIQTWTAEGTKIHNSFELDQNGYNMRYTQENNGYNLYIVTS